MVEEDHTRLTLERAGNRGWVVYREPVVSGMASDLIAAFSNGAELVAWMKAELAERIVHASDCAMHDAPAGAARACNCHVANEPGGWNAVDPSNP